MSFIWELRRHFRDPRTVGALVAGVLTAVAGPEALRGPSRTWSLALLGVLFYKPISPIPFEYLDQPVVLVRSIALAAPVAWLLATGRLAAPLRLAAVAAVLAVGVPRVPAYCSASRSLRALRPLMRGEDPVDPPAGSGTSFRALGKRPPAYRWDEYRSVLAYLRGSTSPRTRVANFLWGFPYPPVNGPAGRLTPFPAAGGYVHLLLVEPGLEARYVEALERTPDSVVVWVPPSATRNSRSWTRPSGGCIDPRPGSAASRSGGMWPRPGLPSRTRHDRSDILETGGFAMARRATTEGRSPGPRDDPEDPGDASQVPRARLVFRVAGGTLAGLSLYLLPALIRSLPHEVFWYLDHPLARIIPIAVLLILGPSLVASVVPRRYRERLAALSRRVARTRPAAFLVDRADRALAPRTRGPLAPVEGFASWVLHGPLTIVLVASSALMLLTWAPHYLTWPWCPDSDQFAVSALSWRAGLVPYRDQADFDFPGPIYLFYLLGVTFGWGQTAPFYAADAALLIALGVALACWSRRLFGRALPGLVAYLPFLGYYLGLDYYMVAERDWHGPLLAALAVMALEARPGRGGRLASALAMAAALLYRPHEVLFLPAVASALLEGCRDGEGGWPRAIGRLAGWCAALAVSLVLVFGPLIVAGALDDFVRALRIARYGGTYNHATWSSFARGLGSHLHDRTTAGTLAAIVLLAVLGPSSLRGPARTWGLAMLGALLYKPISPFPHAYLDEPMVLVRSIALAPLVACLMEANRLAAPLRLAGVAAAIAAGVPSVPAYCSASRSLRALGPLMRGEDPVDPPPGCDRRFLDQPETRYPWGDYRRLLAYIRRSTSPRTRVANLLHEFPLPTVNGPTGRRNPFPAAGGYVHLWSVDPGLEARYAEDLELADDSVVVWDPGFPDRKFPLLDRSVRRWYRPAARFGHIEVWRHVAPPGPPAADPAPPSRHP